MRNFSRAIRFPECCRDIFNVFFDTRWISRHFLGVSRKIVKNVEITKGKVNCQANFHWWKAQMYIDNFVYQDFFGGGFFVFLYVFWDIFWLLKYFFGIFNCCAVIYFVYQWVTFHTFQNQAFSLFACISVQKSEWACRKVNFSAHVPTY